MMMCPTRYWMQPLSVYKSVLERLESLEKSNALCVAKMGFVPIHTSHFHVSDFSLSAYIVFWPTKKEGLMEKYKNPSLSNHHLTGIPGTPAQKCSQSFDTATRDVTEGPQPRLYT